MQTAQLENCVIIKHKPYIFVNDDYHKNPAIKTKRIL